MLRLLASSLLLFLVTGCAIVPLDSYYGNGYSHRSDRNHYDDRNHRDHRNYDDDYWRRTH